MMLADLYTMRAFSIQMLGVLTGILGVVYFLYKAALPKPIPGIPYNKDAVKSLFGDFPTFMKWRAERPELWAWVSTQSYKLNSPVIQLFMRPLGRPWVVVADFREAEDIMTRRAKEFGRARLFYDFFSPLLPNSHIHMPMNEVWRAHRRLVGDVFVPEFLHGVALPRIRQMTLNTMQLWEEKARLAQGRPFYALSDVHHMALEIMWAVAFGTEIETTTDQCSVLSPRESIPLPVDRDSPVTFPTAPINAAFNSIITLTNSVEIPVSSPFPRQTYLFALTFYPRLRSAVAHKNQLIKERLNAAWQRLSRPHKQEGAIRCATDLFVQREINMAKKDNRAPQYDTPVIRDELFNFLVAGLDTTSITVCWGLKFLTANQGVQKQLRAALHEQYIRASEAGQFPTAEEMLGADIPYLDAVIEEVHRLGGTASVNTRVALCDTQILGCHIPKGTELFMPSQGPSYVSPSIAVDESKRGATSSEFKNRFGVWNDASIGDFLPERWLVEDTETGRRFNPNAGPSHPFGAGPRGCLGRKFATLELKMVITLIVWNFMLEPTPKELSSFGAQDLMAHTPQQCYIRLAKAR
ncbi:hypothetical protein FHL15_003190 [Xylaria flabelliformis]|uniref:Uncharacterized protein n=1 Tax=Xylaria flabelliformis TaxID=2512241 RepID=A0A553I772_9PEZI|nr:hypothetical protein FHL15_003190 [Xylaria flabelliformis]